MLQELQYCGNRGSLAQVNHQSGFRQVARLICCKRTEREELCCFDSLPLAVNFLLKERVAVRIAVHLAVLALALADGRAVADWPS